MQYLDSGWQSLVDGLRRVAEAHGARILERAAVTAIDAGERVRGLRFEDGSLHCADAVLLAVPPAAAAALDTACRTPLHRWAETAVPVRAACLDLALASLPRPRMTFALGIDEPVYFSVHSASARLAPRGAALVHAAEYLDGETGSEARLTRLMDRLQPDWRHRVVLQRYLPSMTVTSALPLASQGGLSGRPGSAVPGFAGLYVAGDWVGPEGLLADASLASARQAVHALLAEPRAMRRMAQAT